MNTEYILSEDDKVILGKAPHDSEVQYGEGTMRFKGEESQCEE
jgi:hypothetical protein